MSKPPVVVELGRIRMNTNQVVRLKTGQVMRLPPRAKRSRRSHRQWKDVCTWRACRSRWRARCAPTFGCRSRVAQMFGALVLCALIAGTVPDAPDPSTPKKAEPTELVDFDSDSPPLTKYDLEQEKGDTPKERSLTGQLVRTVIMLMVVVGVIYLLGRFALQRGFGRAPTAGSMIQILERVQVDTRNSLMLVRVSRDQVFLVGNNDKGLKLISTVTLTEDEMANAKPANFKSVLDKISGLRKGPEEES